MVAHPCCLRCKWWGGDGLCMIRYDRELYPNLPEKARFPLPDDPLSNCECPFHEMAVDAESEEWEDEEDWEEW